MPVPEGHEMKFLNLLALPAAHFSDRAGVGVIQHPDPRFPDISDQRFRFHSYP